MPYFLATAKHFYTIRIFRERVSQARDLLVPLAYEDYLTMRSLTVRGAIFGDIDRLTGDMGRRMAQRAERARNRMPPGAILNHPGRSMQRYELLRHLAARGINSFGVYRLTEARRPARYPVFLRRMSGHDGAGSALLPDEAALDREIEKLVQAGTPRDDILIVEYLDYRSADGYFRKYGAFFIGSRFIPYHIEIADNWIVKIPTVVSEATLEEELAYVRGKHEHEALIREIFAMANIQYGRIDYTLVDGKPQIFEINTNPVIIGPRSKIRERRPVFEHAIPRMVRALRAVDEAAAAAAEPRRARHRRGRGAIAAARRRRQQTTT